MENCPKRLKFAFSGRKEIHPCRTGHRPFGAAALFSLHLFSWSLQAGQRVPLTMCIPWMTCFFFLSSTFCRLCVMFLFLSPKKRDIWCMMNCFWFWLEAAVHQPVSNSYFLMMPNWLSGWLPNIFGLREASFCFLQMNRIIISHHC